MDGCLECGKAWVDHLGVMGTCRELRRSQESNARLLAALKLMLDTHGMHGPCENHECEDCHRARIAARAAIKEGKDAP